MRFRQRRGAQIRRPERSWFLEVPSEGPRRAALARWTAGRRTTGGHGERRWNPLDARGPGSARGRPCERRTQSEDDVARRLCAPNAEGFAGRAGRWPDRKSTRLNSSHGYISYAVFCLKKKKKLILLPLRRSRL